MQHIAVWWNYIHLIVALHRNTTINIVLPRNDSSHCYQQISYYIVSGFVFSWMHVCKIHGLASQWHHLKLIFCTSPLNFSADSAVLRLSHKRPPYNWVSRLRRKDEAKPLKSGTARSYLGPQTITISVFHRTYHKQVHVICYCIKTCLRKTIRFWC